MFDNWNRLYAMLYRDEKLKQLLLIPDSDFFKPALFRDKYFINSQKADAVIDNTVDCRVIFYQSAMTETGNERVQKQAVVFEIMVKRTHLYDVSDNAFVRRDKEIAERIYTILSRKYLYGFQLRPMNKGDLEPSSEGYSRYMTAFEYKQVF